MGTLPLEAVYCSSFRQTRSRNIIIVTSINAETAAASIAATSTSAAWVNGSIALVQVGLVAAGMIPGIGTVVNLGSAAIALATGDLIGAGLAAAAAVPILGWAANLGRMERVGIGIYRGARANAGFARFGSAANKNVRAVEKALKMNADEKYAFKEHLHEFKGKHGMGGNDNSSYQKIKELGEGFLEWYRQ